MQQRLLIAATLAACLSAAGPIAAEIFLLKDGQLIDGVIRYEDETNLAVEVDGKLRLIRRDQIDRILYDAKTAADDAKVADDDANAADDDGASDSSAASADGVWPLFAPGLQLRVGAWHGPQDAGLESPLATDFLLGGSPSFSTRWDSANTLAVPLGVGYIAPLGKNGGVEFGLDVFATSALYSNNVINPAGPGFTDQEIRYSRLRGDLFAGYRGLFADNRLSVSPRLGIASFAQSIERKSTAFSPTAIGLNNETRDANAMGPAFGLELEYRVLEELGIFADYWQALPTGGSAEGSFDLTAAGLGGNSGFGLALGQINSDFEWSMNRFSFGVRYYPAENWRLSGGFRQERSQLSYPGYFELGLVGSSDGTSGVILDFFELLTDDFVYGRESESVKGNFFFEVTYLLDL